LKENRNLIIRELAKSLVKTQSLKFGVFKLTSGKMSSYYIDLRLVPSYPKVFKRIIEMYTNIIVNEIGLSNFDLLCGIPTSGLVFASAIAYYLEKPLIYIRKDVKAHGTQKNIEGVLKPGDRVLLIDDLITTGSSLMASAEIVLGEGGVINDAIVLVDREEGGIENLSKSNIRVHYVAKVSELAKELYENNIIGEEEYNAVLKQIEKKDKGFS